eukprot:g2808.t1
MLRCMGNALASGASSVDFRPCSIRGSYVYTARPRFQEHNATAPVMRQIQPADWIIGVSDLEGAGRTLMDKVINAEKELTLKVAVWR